MSLSERDAGSRFQIALKGDCAALIWERDHQVDAPWRVLRRMNKETTKDEVVAARDRKPLNGESYVMWQKPRTFTRRCWFEAAGPPSRCALRWTTFVWLANRSSRDRWQA